MPASKPKLPGVYLARCPGAGPGHSCGGRLRGQLRFEPGDIEIQTEVRWRGRLTCGRCGMVWEHFIAPGESPQRVEIRCSSGAVVNLPVIGYQPNAKTN